MPESPRGGHRELPGPRPEVRDPCVLAEAARCEGREVLRRIRIPLLPVVPRDEVLVEMLRPRVRHLVQHPLCVSHPQILYRTRRRRD